MTKSIESKKVGLILILNKIINGKHLTTGFRSLIKNTKRITTLL